MGDHTEAISIDFDPKRISYSELLEHFWESHHCSTNTTRIQYMNAVFYRDDQQRVTAQQSLIRAAQKRRIPQETVKTKILPFTQFSYAENYHQKYVLKHPVRQFLEETYPNTKSFADSTVAMKLTVFLRSDQPQNQQEFLRELPNYGLPKEYEDEFRKLAQDSL